MVLLSMLNFALPLNALVPRRVTKLMPMPPVCTFRSLPPVLTADLVEGVEVEIHRRGAARRRVGDDDAVQVPHRVGGQSALADEARLLTATRCRRR